ncbi:MAG TPA: A/G-specific adenine glycosylase [Steroidobacteraceae bacterium]|nr:A/G-specific adenine glycosylase [Steroidobacteraceae bacterium]
MRAAAARERSGRAARGVETARSPIAAALIDWHARSGRHDLPWQRDRTAYRVWVSEIMLQQTQVATVVPYFERFMERFPSVRALADAPLDAVLHLWSGLGYYARARNLHRAAQRICADWGGQFPPHFAQVASLPGIGRSTAGAILALSRGERHPILDGNVRRVLARYFGIEGDPSRRATLERLWLHSAECTPHQQVATYTQAIMDLGASVCTRHRPRCANCPLESGCLARREGRQHELPQPRAGRARGARHTFMLLAARADGGVLLVRRPPQGVWGGLWSPPEFPSIAEARAFAAHALEAARCEPTRLPPLQHAFTHFDLTVTPLRLECTGLAVVMEAPEALWYNPRLPPAVGLPAPVRALLERGAESAERG